MKNHLINARQVNVNALNAVKRTTDSTPANSFSTRDPISGAVAEIRIAKMLSSKVMAFRPSVAPLKGRRGPH